jgi:hypothetical protein
MTQNRYLEVENWFDRYSADRKFLHATANDDAVALGILSESKICRGSYSEAEPTLSQAMVCLEENGLRYSNIACHIMSLSSWLKWCVSDLASCEQSLREHVSIAQTIGDEMETAYAVAQIWDFYKGQGRLDMAAHIAATYPDILGK